MIAVYAQASDHQGIDLAIDGVTVSSDDRRFTSLREKSAALNFRRFPANVGDVTIHCGMGIARLQFQPAEEDSPVVVVVSDRLLGNGGVSVTTTVMSSVNAIGRSIAVEELSVALRVASDFLQMTRVRKLIAIGVAASAVAIAALILTRRMMGRR